MSLPSRQPPDPKLLNSAAQIVEQLVGVGADPEQLLLVGASCRDIIHSTLGFHNQLRRTDDWDFGLAVASWAEYDAIVQHFPEAGTNGLRRRVGGYVVDLTPFGGLEAENSRVISPPDQNIDVFGFRDVFAGAERLTPASGLSVRIPRPEGFAALKMRSWLDRSHPARGEYKDAVDIATAIMWFADSPEVQDWLYQDEGLLLLEEADFLPEVAAAKYLSTRIQSHLSEPVAQELLSQWRETNFELLQRNIRRQDIPTWPSSEAEQIAMLVALGRGSLPQDPLPEI